MNMAILRVRDAACIGDDRNSAQSSAGILRRMEPDSDKSVIVVGGGVAGMSAACALAEAGLRVRLIERRGYLGGRASSYRHPGVDEVIDNCQHVLFGCCTNLIGFYERIGVADRIRWTNTMTMIEPGGRRTLLASSRWLPAPLHGLPSLMRAKALTREDKKALARAFRALMRPVPADSKETLGEWLKRNGQTPGAIERFWRLVIASALNADVDVIALPYAAKVIRELFLNSAAAGRMGMSTVPLSQLYCGAEQYLREHGGEVVLSAGVESAAWDEETSHWTLATRAGANWPRISWCWRFRLKQRRNCCRRCHLPMGPRRSPRRLGSTNMGPSAACTSGSTAKLPTSTTRCCSIARFTGCTTKAGCSRGGI